MLFLIIFCLVTAVGLFACVSHRFSRLLSNIIEVLHNIIFFVCISAIISALIWLICQSISIIVCN
jgi:branched-subunit amino acid permease